MLSLQHPRPMRSLRPPRRLARALTALFAGGFLVAGWDVQSPTTPGPRASLTVTPDVIPAINATQQFTAVGLDAAGNAYLDTDHVRP